MKAPSLFAPRARFLAFPILLAVMCCALAAAQDVSADQALAVPARPLITQPIDEAQLTTLKGNTHPLARREFDLGTAPASLPMQRMLLVLKRSPDQEHALRTLLDSQQDKGSPSYHKWLTPEDFGRQFGPTDADMQTIIAWLQSHGFQVAATPSKGRTFLEFSGSASQVQEAFHTSIHKYIVKGEQHWANANDPRIPTALTPAVVGIRSLHNFRAKPMNVLHGVGTREKTTGRVTPKANPEFTFTPGGTNSCNAQDNNCYSVGPFDFAAIYNVTPQWNAGIDGTGQRIAIVQETNINPADPQAFRSLFGLPATPNSPNVILNGPDPGIVLPGSSLEAEANIDVQWSGAVAKGATIDLVVSAPTDTTDGIDLSATYIVENNIDGIMSESFGQCEAFIGNAGNQFFSGLWEQAAAQGISVFVSSGDQGAAVCDGGNAPNQPAQDGLQVSGFASTAFNVAVGGTDFQDVFNPETYWNPTNDSNQASAKGYIPETTWNSTCTNILFGQIQGFSADIETNCNDPRLANFLAPVGGSGGASNCSNSSVSGNQITCLGGNPKPSWQTGTGVPTDNVRDVPDVSLFASSGFEGNSYMFCEQDISSDGSCDLSAPFTTIGMAGGTSFGAPAFAGIVALINQKTGSRQGNPNYVFYKLAAQTPATNCNSTTGPAAACVFNDVTGGTIRMPCVTGSLDCTTIHAGDRVGILNGYDTTTGYDLATGLGTVNVNNLVNQWDTVTFTATTTTLKLNGGTAPISVAHGNAIPVEISVTSGSGTPTGDVALTGEIGPIMNVNGSAFFRLVGGSTGNGASTSILPGGTYNVRAHYEGDGTFAPSDSAPPGIPVTVTAENSTTTLSNVTISSNNQIVSVPNGTSVPFGSFLFVRADVAGLSGQGVPTGKVQFTAAPGSASLPTQGLGLGNTSPVQVLSNSPLNSQGSTSVGPGLINFDTGNYSISASYPGDLSFAASTSTAPVTFTITSGFTGVSGLADVVIASPSVSGTTTLGVVASTGFTTPVGVTCSGLPIGASCKMPSITPNGPNNIVTGTITVTITRAVAALAPHHRTYYFAAILGGGLPLAGIFLLSAPKRQRWSVLLSLLMLALLIGLAACGGGSHSTPPPPPPTTTPAGTYKIFVTATAGSQSQQEGSFFLVVQ